MPKELEINKNSPFRSIDSDPRVRAGNTFLERNTPGTLSPAIIRQRQGKRIVPGVENPDVHIVLGAVHILWMQLMHRLPTVKQICERATQVDPDHVRKILAHKRFRSLCLERGIQWPDKWNEAEHNGAVLRSNLRPEQAQVLAMVLEPSRDSFQQRLRKAGITAATWMNWMQDPMFEEAVRVSSENMLGASQAAIHASVVDVASKGNVQAQRLYYELTGRHDPAKQQMIEFKNMIGLLLEVLTRHVTDPVILNRINSDLDRVINGHQLKEIDIIPANYEVVETPVQQVVGGDKIRPIDEIPDGFFDMEITNE